MWDKLSGNEDVCNLEGDFEMIKESRKNSGK